MTKIDYQLKLNLINAHELVNLFMLKNILAQMERKLAVIIELIPDKLTTKFLKS